MIEKIITHEHLGPTEMLYVVWRIMHERGTHGVMAWNELKNGSENWNKQVKNNSNVIGQSFVQKNQKECIKIIQ